ncbi:hypothetical protein ACP70R_049541 [Stipagrostis hirtigluma subsp. patula]
MPSPSVKLPLPLPPSALLADLLTDSVADRIRKAPADRDSDETPRPSLDGTEMGELRDPPCPPPTTSSRPSSTGCARDGEKEEEGDG